MALAWAGCSGEDREARALAADLSGEVRSGAMDDCQALALFAESVQSSELGLMGDAFNVFIPRGKANYPLGWLLDLVGTEKPIKFEGSRSGYRPEFRKGYEPGRLEGTADDQAHHFAPYFILGARVPQSLAERFLESAERTESWGDLNLGREAIELGAQLRMGEIAHQHLAREIRGRLCLPGRGQRVSRTARGVEVGDAAR